MLATGCAERPDLKGLLVRPDGIVAWAGAEDEPAAAMDRAGSAEPGRRYTTSAGAGPGGTPGAAGNPRTSPRATAPGADSRLIPAAA